MKKIIAVSTLVLTVLLGSVLPVSAADEIKVILDGQEIVFDQPPVIMNDRTMVPMRAIFEALGAEVEWDAETRTASGAKMGVVVEFTIDESVMYKNYIALPIDAPATIVNDRTLVPLRAVSESFGVDVIWDAETRTVNMTDKHTLSMEVPYEGMVYSGEMQDGIPQGYGTLIITENGTETYFVGYSENGIPLQGIVAEYYADGSYMLAEVANGEAYGYCEYHYADGSYMKGTIANGELNGQVEYYDASTGATVTGNFVNGEFVAN